MKTFNPQDIPDSIQEFILDCWMKGFRLCLVGGYVRDYFLQRSSNDFDFEIRHTNGLKGEAWIDFLKTQFPQASYIGMGVLRIKLSDIEIEISSPRLEEFNDEIDHKNFSPIFDSSLSFADSFKRRDLRLNAIGISFYVENGHISGQVEDPYKGINDIEDRIISRICDDFFFDPVRLLRAIRFSINFNFKMVNTKDYKKFDLSKISLHYLKYESGKCHNHIEFIEVLVALIKDCNIAIPKDLNAIKNYQSDFIIDEIHNLEEAILYCKTIVDTEIYKFLAIRKNLYSKINNFKVAMNLYEANQTPDNRYTYLKELARLEEEPRLKSYALYREIKKKLENIRTSDERTQLLMDLAAKNS